MSATGRVGANGEAGATLLEMLVVLTIMVMATAIVFPALRRPYQTLAAQSSRLAVASALRGARAEAVREDRAVSFVVAPDGRSYATGDQRTLLPASVRLQADTDPILFSGDGSSSGARLLVEQANGHRYGLELDAPTGVVRLEPPA